MIHNQANINALNDMNNLDAGMTKMDLNKLDNLNTDNTLTAGVDSTAGVFEGMLTAGLEKLNGSEKAIGDNLANMSDQLKTDPTKMADPTTLNNLQAAMATDVTNFTVGSKVVNLGVKFVNEMTHLN